MMAHNCSRSTVDRRRLFSLDARTMLRRCILLLIPFFVAVCSLSQSQSLELNLGSILDSGITNTDSFEAFRSSPSLMFGNLFNRKYGTIEAPTNGDSPLEFEVLEIRRFPGFSGNHVWGHITPEDSEPQHCASTTGCWVFLGLQKESLEKVSMEKFALRHDYRTADNSDFSRYVRSGRDPGRPDAPSR